MKNNQTKFKETELGMIPEDWEVLSLRELLINKGYIRGPFGSALRRPEMKTSGIPVYEQQNAIYNHRDFRFFIDSNKYSELKRFTVNPNDIIISCSGTLGKTTIINEGDPEGIISQALLLLRPNTKLADPKFLNYFLSSDEGQGSLKSRSHGSVQTNIAKREDVENIQLIVPSLPEQKKIAGFLGALDDKIELNRKMNKTLEQIAQAIFKKWFINEEEYNLGKLCDIATVLTGKRPNNRSEYKTDDFEIPIIGANGIMGYTDERMFNDENIIITGRVGTLGSLHRMYDACWTSDNALVTISDFPNFTYQLMKSIDFESLNRGSTQPLIAQSDLQNYPIILPPNSLIEQYENFAQQIYQFTYNNNREIEILSQIRDSLLPRLMSGKLRVR